MSELDKCLADARMPDANPIASKVQVTDRMRRAGAVAQGFAEDHVVAGPIAVEVYRAMHAVAPVEFVLPIVAHELDHQAEAYVRDLHMSIERLGADITALHDALKVRTDERDAAKDALAQALSDIEGFRSVRDTYLDKMERDAATIAGLKSQLAQRPEPVPDTPKPAHDFTRVPARDRRMMGF